MSQLIEKELIDVTCIVLPDGGALHFEGHDADRARNVWSAWSQSLAEARRAELHDTMGGCVLMRMLRQDYMNIQATSQTAPIFAAAGV